MQTSATFIQQAAMGRVAVDVTRHTVLLPPHVHVPYEGSDPAVAASFRHGFAPSFGSGIALREKLADGTLVFYCLTDRGPNGDGPQVPGPDGALMDSKLFPAPNFTPSIGVLQVDAHGAALVSSLPIRMSATQPVSGLPLPPGTLGNSAEIPLHDSLRFEDAGRPMFHAGGIDSEAMAYDRVRGMLWITDEYGPFLLQIDPATGLVQARYGPGHGLPSILARRRANRGMEGMALDPASGRIHAFLQSPLSGDSKDVERYARFLRWVEFDPASGATVRMLAYPLEAAAFAGGKTGHAKLGDMAPLGDGKFVVIEQAQGSDGRMFHHLVMVDLAGATDIGAAACNPHTADLEHSSLAGEAVNGASWAQVIPLKKTLLLDLNALGWTAEKAEGLALVDGRTLALTNDSDFGMQTRVYDAAGQELHEDVTQFEADSAGHIVAGSARAHVVRVAPAEPDAGVFSLWLLRFERPLLDYAV
ncbi:esterase-like activity of phytase family protein [Massilia sp. PAMC28688]|uniref:esterase-like activity of phytase family protein n=1 Tax=Massilia sp. PAMC28688 TaxID=2861283 RepID=UPI001C62920C|nr:esterase-like activity of phytase family protein [Massilia sp. PAMC28688]QYF95467.1 esterase-like activity of phytase family protein [Massilia sp. PAMC28688]